MKDHNPLIEPLPENIERPLWSVMIPTYNCANYLRQTLESVLANDPGPEEMQIEVVDDCSIDDPERVVWEIGQGRISFHRQPYNVGATANFNTCIQRSQGQLVHILHGDDYVLPEFYQQILLGMKWDNVGAAFCRCHFVDENDHRTSTQKIITPVKGVLENWMTKIGEKNLVLCPSIVVKRVAYEQLGGYNLELIHAADWEMWRRLSTRFDCWYEPEPLICYRVHSKSDTSKLIRSGRNVADTRKSIQISSQYLNPEITKNALKNYSLSGLRLAQHFAEDGDLAAVVNQIKESIQCYIDFSTVWFIVRNILPAVFRRQKEKGSSSH